MQDKNMNTYTFFWNPVCVTRYNYKIDNKSNQYKRYVIFMLVRQT